MPAGLREMIAMVTNPLARYNYFIKVTTTVHFFYLFKSGLKGYDSLTPFLSMNEFIIYINQGSKFYFYYAIIFQK